MTSLPKTLPKELTAKQWRDKKGLFTKAVTDASGIGGALDKLERAWAAVPWATVDPYQATAAAVPTGDVTTDVLDRLEPLAKQHQTQVGAARHELQAVETLAKNTGDQWRKNKLVPAASLKYVDQVHSTAATLGKTIDEFDKAWQSYRFTAKRGRVARTDAAIVLTQVRGAVNGLRAATQTAQNKQNLANYRKMAQGLRPAIDALSKSSDPAHQALKARLETLVADQFYPKTEDDAQSNEAIARIQRVANVLKNVNI